MLANIAGNGYCASHYIPWTLALLSTYGRFARDPTAPVASPEDVPGEATNVDASQGIVSD